MVETLSIAVIGAPGVGKTSIIRQFIYNDFSEAYTPTRTRYVFRPSVILNGNMYELKILDVPPISSFPASASQEWLDLRCRGVRNANAYILVYDICCVESFEYVKMIKQQIMENRYAHIIPPLLFLKIKPLMCNLLPSLLVSYIKLPGYLETSHKAF
ncbi:hypothetical protein XENORESO_011935 [Xenotaenia resolanae]|uniref:Ras-like protein family member 10B n=1 Tax=Xenotaenia resolanae TaxID=208358 RepID=A0ABV0WAT1_9TELE